MATPRRTTGRFPRGYAKDGRDAGVLVAQAAKAAGCRIALRSLRIFAKALGTLSVEPLRDLCDRKLHLAEGPGEVRSHLRFDGGEPLHRGPEARVRRLLFRKGGEVLLRLGNGVTITAPECALTAVEYMPGTGLAASFAEEMIAWDCAVAGRPLIRLIERCVLS